MNKKMFFLPLFLVFGIMTWFLWKAYFKKIDSSPRRAQSSQKATNEVLPKLQEKDLKKPYKTKNHMAKTINSSRGPWEKVLEEALRAQGGDDLKEIFVKRVESIPWTQDGITLRAESTIITLKSHTGQETIFRALVDSETGKILKTWDHPVIDPMNSTERGGLKVDPRYLQN